MEGIFWAVITIAIVIASIFFIFLILELRTLSAAFRQFLLTTGDSVRPTMDELQKTLAGIRTGAQGLEAAADELQKTLRSMRNMTDNITTVTNDITVFSGSVRDVGENVKHVTEVVNEAATSASGRINAVRAGIVTGAGVFLKNLIKNKTV